MAIWFRVTRWYEIEEVEVVKETEHKLMLPKRNYNGNHDYVSKRSDWQNFFPTEQEAIDFIRARASAEVESAEKQLEQARKRTAHILDGSPIAVKRLGR